MTVLRFRYGSASSTRWPRGRLQRLSQIWWEEQHYLVTTWGLIAATLICTLVALHAQRNSFESACIPTMSIARQMGLTSTTCNSDLFAEASLSALLHLYPHEQMVLALPQEERADWWVPWPNNFVGRLGWYRQGLHEVQAARVYIRSLATKEVPAILIAAAIANQGNSPQRPFGWSGLERLQQWLGHRFEWQLALWHWAQARWNNYFEEPSVGVGQIQPDEAVRLVYAGDRLDLFDDHVSIALMQAKLARAAALLAPLELNTTDRFALIAISNNDNSDGAAILSQFEAADQDLYKLLRQNDALRRQLARMMTYITYLHDEGDWMLPAAINVERLWWYIDVSGTEQAVASNSVAQ